MNGSKLTVVSGKTRAGEIAPTVETGNGVALIEHAEIRQQVRDLRRAAEESYWDLSVGLHEVYTNSYYIAWGFQSWKEYVEADLDFQPRKAQYLVSIQEWFGRMKPGVQDWIREMGWTKAKELVGVVTNENAKEWQGLLRGKSYKDMMSMLSGSTDDDGDSNVTPIDKNGEKASRKAFGLYPDQLANVDQAIQKAMEIAQSDKEGHALDMICVDFLATNGGVDSLQDFLRKVERQTGVNLIAYDKGEDAILFGGELLDAFAAEEG